MLLKVAGEDAGAPEVHRGGPLAGDPAAPAQQRCRARPRAEGSYQCYGLCLIEPAAQIRQILDWFQAQCSVLA
jgi:hypothetical protein